MSEEFPAPTYSSFWPLLIFFIGSITWTSFQIYQINVQRLNLIQQTASSTVMVNKSQDAQSKFANLGQDLLQVSVNDSNAAAIVREIGLSSQPAPGAKTPTPTPTPAPH
jgi:hypothetical protein